MDGRHKRDGRREQFWREVVASWRRSGQSVRAFCAQADLSEPSFYAWRRTLQSRERERERQRPTAPSGPTLVPVRVVPDVPVEVVLPNGLVIRMPAGADVQAVAKLVTALGSASC